MHIQYMWPILEELQKPKTLAMLKKALNRCSSPLYKHLLELERQGLVTRYKGENPHRCKPGSRKYIDYWVDTDIGMDLSLRMKEKRNI